VETIIISCLLSIILSIFIGNVVGCYYLSKLNKNWEESLIKLQEEIKEKEKEDEKG
jgi:hypothetical protein